VVPNKGTGSLSHGVVWPVIEKPLDIRHFRGAVLKRQFEHDISMHQEAYNALEAIQDHRVAKLVNSGLDRNRHPADKPDDVFNPPQYLVTEHEPDWKTMHQLRPLLHDTEDYITCADLVISWQTAEKDTERKIHAHVRNRQGKGLQYNNKAHNAFYYKKNEHDKYIAIAWNFYNAEWNGDFRPRYNMNTKYQEADKICNTRPGKLIGTLNEPDR